MRTLAAIVVLLPEGSAYLTYPAEGRYRLVLQYAQEPWTISKRPKVIFTTRSPEFRVTQK
ncbi:MAG TPA: hypothetical protein VEO74_14140 [Thermoanaerobaculia bacterium]|nr:hypothetical protein [Thermoanaerobaculia bacterium]